MFIVQATIMNDQPVNEWLNSFVTEALDVEGDHSLGEGEEPFAGLEMTQSVRPWRHNHVTV